MKKTLFLFLISFLSLSGFSQSASLITLSQPDLSRGEPLMKALSQRASGQNFSSAEISLQDLSDLLWAANGINRPAEGKRTAASAQNAQDVEVYAILPGGIYLYDAQNHQLDLVAAGDHRLLAAGRQEQYAAAPLILLLVSDVSRFRSGDQAQRLNLGALDVGIVSQNIMLFCASEGLVSRPRVGMDRPGLINLLSLSPSHHPMLNIPISY